MFATMNSVRWSHALLGFGFLRIASAFLTQPQFKADKFVGKWYTIGISVKGGGVKNTYSHLVTVELEESGELGITVEKPEDSCAKIQFNLLVGEKPGKYIRDTGTQRNTITIIETDYDSFCILGTETDLVNTLNLYSRHEDVSDEVKAKFEYYIKCLDFPTNRIVYFSKQESWC
ncbi:epididymal secretory protein 4-like [Sceloporus undulatus]|uniref:epididymal secretory protein 4-like n=1 Tax=Sceloporus undulatus TaxID=8520 RepID=UPI001C4B0249|nr:epididymal secretory protein 4-like [Sceloporus undulatus]